MLHWSSRSTWETVVDQPVVKDHTSYMPLPWLKIQKKRTINSVKSNRSSHFIVSNTQLELFLTELEVKEEEDAQQQDRWMQAE